MMKTNFVETIPIDVDADEVWRIGGTRVTLDTIVAAYNDGATAEEIAQQYSSVSLADVYSVIAYYLHRQPEVEKYPGKRLTQAAETRRENEARFNPHGIRERLLARKNNGKI